MVHENGVADCFRAPVYAMCVWKLSHQERFDMKMLMKKLVFINLLGLTWVGVCLAAGGGMLVLIPADIQGRLFRPWSMSA